MQKVAFQKKKNGKLMELPVEKDASILLWFGIVRLQGFIFYPYPYLKENAIQQNKTKTIVKCLKHFLNKPVIILLDGHSIHSKNLEAPEFAR